MMVIMRIMLAAVDAQNCLASSGHRRTNNDFNDRTHLKITEKIPRRDVDLIAQVRELAFASNRFARPSCGKRLICHLMARISPCLVTREFLIES